MKQVLIVGGGSAGWITATYLDATLNGSGPKRVSLTLVESASIGRIGVGEATIPTIKTTLSQIGIGEVDFMRATSATFKHGILFRNWAGQNHRYFHPFDRRQTGTFFDQSGVRWIFSNGATPFAETVSMQPNLAGAALSPKTLEEADFEAHVPYAYHMDAESFADYLQTIATKRGVRRIVDDVTNVGIRAPGEIAWVRTRSGLELSADLYIDCSGFAAVLSGKALGAKFIDYSPWLLCDRAVAMRVPYDLQPQKGLRPFTTASALSAGWCWDIGLQDRRGVGYVYSSQFITDDEAEQELRAFEGAHCQAVTARRLKFRVGRSASPWMANCVAIGLSSGFIEPLESTGLYLIELAAKILCEHFPFVADEAPLREKFNRIVSARFEELLLFIALHYCITQRQDTEFWREVQKPDRIPPGLQDLLQLWNSKPPSASDFTDTLQLFSDQNYEYILFGMDWRPALAQADTGRNTRVLQPSENLARAESRARMELPLHEDWLRQRVGREQLDMAV